MGLIQPSLRDLKAEIMPDIVLTTINAKYIHASFGLRYLLANMGALKPKTVLAEFEIQQRAVDIVERLLLLEPVIVGIGVYVWNAALCAEVAHLLKRLRPEIILVLGGPEISFETEQQTMTASADYVITGEGDLKFAWLCSQILEGQRPSQKIIPAELPNLAEIALPYDFYTDEDVAHRIVYVEASRGCPFTCEFCLSSLDVPVRQFPLERFLGALQKLLDRRVQHFKFVDRTFNLNITTSKSILEFFRERLRPGLFLHFEMIPDRLPEALRELIARFPSGTLQFEVGVQTFNDAVSERIKRRQNNEKLAENFQFLRQRTGVHIHADLIAGLPGEDWKSFGAGFDRLVQLDPQEIQVGILKRLRGTPIVRHDAAWAMVYNPNPPYEILRNKSLSFPELQRLRRFSRHWDLVANSGNFVETKPLIWRGSDSPFDSFMALSGWLYQKAGRTHSIALPRLMELVFAFLTEFNAVPAVAAAATMWRDYQRAGRSDVPLFLRPHLPDERREVKPPSSQFPGRRQARHMAVVAR